MATQRQFNRQSPIANRQWALALAFAVTTAAAGAQSGLGDPTKPTALTAPEEERAAQGPRWRLQSTLVADTRRLAVINGRTVAQGGRIDGATLLEVRQDGVTLEVAGERIRLRLLNEAVNVKRSGG
jgi:MSHA biogenesis protein MshK